MDSTVLGVFVCVTTELEVVNRMVSVFSKKRHVLGLGLDNHDGHRRITVTESFFVLGGSEKTHAYLTQILINASEDLKNHGKLLAETEPEELLNLITKHAQCN